jgi:hypothetical protein
MFPHERSLVERLKDEPFALIGVNSDADLAEVKPKFADEKITWRSFWNGSQGPSGPIAATWDVSGWPTLYLLDHEGRIRRKYLGSPGDAVLDREIDQLVAEAKAARTGAEPAPSPDSPPAGGGF